MNKYSNKALVCVDGSYLFHFCINSAVKRWSYKSPNAKILKDPEETDQDNLPDLIVYSDFCRELEDALVRKLENINGIIQSSLDTEFNAVDFVNKIFAIDSPIYANWRKKIYPEYKAQRKAAPKMFNIGSLMSYTENLLRNKLRIDEQGYTIVKVESAEGDDIIAAACREFQDYKLKVLIASDRDYLQLDNVQQFDLFGTKREILPKLVEKFNEPISPKEYLAIKCLVGDGADNIAGCFTGVGETRAYKLVKDPQQLKQRLSEDANAARQFLLNKKIISFDYIPQDLTDKILNVINDGFKKSEAEQSKPVFDLDDLMSL